MYHDNEPSGVGNSRGAKLLDGNTSGKARRQSQNSKSCNCRSVGEHCTDSELRDVTERA